VEEGGKPWFPSNPDICFSLSHTRGAAACALWNRPVGVDVEHRRPVSRRLLEQLGAADEEDFLRRWVCREAAAKRLGLGSVGALRRSVSGEERCSLFSPGKGLLAAVSAEGAVRWESLGPAELLARLSRRGE